jgi:hypothetical protein
LENQREAADWYRDLSHLQEHQGQFPEYEQLFNVEITLGLERMTYKLFSNWVEQKRALIGFDLTDQLLQ